MQVAVKRLWSLRDIRKQLDEKGINVEMLLMNGNTLEDIKFFVDNKVGHIIQIKTPDLAEFITLLKLVYIVKKMALVLILVVLVMKQMLVLKYQLISLLLVKPMFV